MSVTYATIDGELVYENRGGAETQYTSDPLGNLIECHGPFNGCCNPCMTFCNGHLLQLSFTTARKSAD